MRSKRPSSIAQRRAPAPRRAMPARTSGSRRRATRSASGSARELAVARVAARTDAAWPRGRAARPIARGGDLRRASAGPPRSPARSGASSARHSSGAGSFCSDADRHRPARSPPTMPRSSANSASGSAKSDDDLEHAAARRAQRARDADQLVAAGGQARRRLAVARAVHARARGGEAERAGARSPRARAAPSSRSRRRSAARAWSAPRSPIT